MTDEDKQEPTQTGEGDNAGADAVQGDKVEGDQVAGDKVERPAHEGRSAVEPEVK